MKRVLAFLLGALVLASFSSSWAQCPEADLDLGDCDTLYLESWPPSDTCYIGCSIQGCDTVCINDAGSVFPRFLHVSLFVTHDSNTFYRESESKWVQDSLKSIVVPLTFWLPEDGCLDSVIFPTHDNWNNTYCGPYFPTMSRSIFRDIPGETPPDTIRNRMFELTKEEGALVWDTIIQHVCNDSCDYQIYGMQAPHVWHSFLAGAGDRSWWEGSRTLLATLTFMIYASGDCDTAEVCFDSTFWPPENFMNYTKLDGFNYVPRHSLPTCDSVVTDVRWIEGSAEGENRPTSFSVSQNYPNPFNPATEFRFDLPRASHVTIEVFNILGQKVKTLVDERRAVGSHVVDWDGKDERGADISSGIYFYKMVADDFSDIKKMVLLK